MLLGGSRRSPFRPEPRRHRLHLQTQLTRGPWREGPALAARSKGDLRSDLRSEIGLASLAHTALGRGARHGARHGAPAPRAPQRFTLTQRLMMPVIGAVRESLG